MHYLICVLTSSSFAAAAPCIASNCLQTILLTSEGLAPLIGSESRVGFAIGPVLELYEAERRRFAPRDGGRFERLTWDPWSASIYGIHGQQLVRVAGDEVSVLAGDDEEEGPVDGIGMQATFLRPEWLVSDGAGTLYCAEMYRILHKIQLPVAWRGGGEQSAAEAAAGGQAVVSTLPFEAEDEIQGLVHVPDPTGGPGSLVYATITALYRVQLGEHEEAAHPVLLAGREDEQGSADGQGQEALFSWVRGLTVDGDGCILCADWQIRTTAVRRVQPDGTVTTLTTEQDGPLCVLSITPNGCLLLSKVPERGLLILDLGLKPQHIRHPTAATPNTSSSASPARSLAADLGSLLVKPHGTADLILQLGERTFNVHRAILVARCDYFRQRLTEGAFSDGAAAQLTLPDADLEAFAVVLWFIYTGVIEIPGELVFSVAELADRLLLPDLCAAACEQVQAGITPERAVDLLLWAEGCVVRGGGFPQLLADMVNWYIDNYDTIKLESGNSLQRLQASPTLLSRLFDASMSRHIKRQRAA